MYREQDAITIANVRLPLREYIRIMNVHKQRTMKGNNREIKTLLACVLLAASNIFFACSAKAQDMGNVRQAKTDLTVQDYESDSIASLKFCTTIDKDIMTKCRKELGKAMNSIDGVYGQVAVVDFQTGHLKAWVALNRDNGKCSDGPLLSKSCTLTAISPLTAACFLSMAGVAPEDSVDMDSGIYEVNDKYVIRDHNWRKGGYGKMTHLQALARKSNVAMYKACEAFGKEKANELWFGIKNDKAEHNAVTLAIAFSGMFRDSLKVLIPTLNEDKVKSEYETTPVPHIGDYVKGIVIGANKEGGSQFNYAPKDFQLAGLYGMARDIKTDIKSDEPLKELSYIGFSSAENPRYAIGLFVDRDGNTPLSPKQLSGLVIELTRWLSKR